jgi:hypothetical protein
MKKTDASFRLNKFAAYINGWRLKLKLALIKMDIIYLKVRNNNVNSSKIS